MIDISEKPYIGMEKTPENKSGIIVIDNGTFEIKAGYKNDPCFMARNKIYKTKFKSSFDPFASSNKHSMFEKDIIVNFEILELTLDNIFEKIDPEYLDELIMTTTPLSPTNENLIDFIFTNYNFNRISLGYDFMFNYQKYFPQENCLIIDISFAKTFVCYVENGKIKDLNRINFGASDLIEYANAVLHNRYKDFKKDYSGIIEYIRVSEDYRNESVEIYNQICNMDYTNNLFLTPPPQELTPESAKIIEEKEIKSTDIPEIDYDCMELPDESLNSLQLKAKRRYKLLFFSTFARLKMKINQCFKSIENIIESNQEELDKINNIKKYIKIKKSKFENLKRELKTRDNLRKCVKDRSTREFIIKNKEMNLTQEEIDIQQQILDAEDMDQEEFLIKSMNELAEIIKKLDPEFIPFYANTVEILKGDNIGRQCLNIDLIKLPEIFFYPSIVKLPEMGISEIIENICDNFEVKNILISGGLAKMKGLKNRIYNEVKRRSKELNIKVVENTQSDPFYGANDCGFTITRDFWKENGSSSVSKEFYN